VEQTAQKAEMKGVEPWAAVLGRVEQDLRAVLTGAKLPPGLAGPLLRGEVRGLPDDRALVLIALDPQGVQRTIMASRKIVTRLGASTAFADWDRDLRAGEVPEIAGLSRAVLYAGGGQALLLAALGDAVQLRERLQSAFQGRGLGHLSTAQRDCSPLELAQGPADVQKLDRVALDRLGIRAGGGGFSGLLTQLHSRLSAERDAPRLGPPASGQRCAECGSRGATIDNNGDYICLTCQRHHRTGGGLLGANGIPETIEDFDSGNLAWLYLDGSQIGKALRKCKTLLGYVEFSAKLLHVFDWARVRLDLAVQGVEEAVPLVRGGDDVGLVFDATRGNGAFSASLSVLEGVARRAVAAGLDIGAGAGLVVSKTLGARQAWDLAKRLVRRAKERSPETGGYALDLEIVDGGTVLGEDLDSLRADRWRQVVHPPRGWTMNRLELTTRPWNLDEARALHALYQQIDARIPDAFSTLRRSGAALREDLYLGLSLSRQALERQRSSDGKQSLWSMLGGKDGLPRPNTEQGWILRPGQGPDQQPCWRTAILDLVELERLHRGVSHD